MILINAPSPVWQYPYVNLFKHFGVGQWKKCSREGDVTATMVRHHSLIPRLVSSFTCGRRSLGMSLETPRDHPLSVTQNSWLSLLSTVTGSGHQGHGVSYQWLHPGWQLYSVAKELLPISGTHRPLPLPRVPPLTIKMFCSAH